MKVHRPPEGKTAVVFEEVEPFFLDLLRRLPAYADPGGDPAAGARLFSAPMRAGGEGDEFNEDWEQYVEPEIKALFQTARETVAGDVAGLPSPPANPPAFDSLDLEALAPTETVLALPRAHLEAWLSVLNQACLVLAARRGFGEREMNAPPPFPPTSERDLDLHRIDFYYFVQDVVLRELGFD